MLSIPYRRSPFLVLVACFVAACGGEASPARTPDSGNSPGSSPGHAAASTGTAAAPPPIAASIVVDTGPVLQEGHAVIRPEAVGPLQVGAWRRVAMSWVYALTSFSGGDDTEITPVHRVGKDTVTVVITNDTVVQLQVMRPGARTLDGIQVGTPLATVRSLPGAIIGHDRSATTVRLPNECGIIFSTADSSAHSGVPKGKGALPFPPDSAVIRTIIVGKCAGT